MVKQNNNQKETKSLSGNHSADLKLSEKKQEVQDKEILSSRLVEYQSSSGTYSPASSDINKELEKELDKQFPKGDKSRGKALVLFAIAQIEIDNARRQLYDYYFKKIKNPVIISKDEYDKLIHYSESEMKEERKKVLEDVRKMINKISDLNFSIQIKKRLLEELNKLENSNGK